MPDFYDTPDDGKLYTRYSDLTKCYSIHSARIVAQEMLLKRRQARRDPTMHFGSVRHKMWEEESKETGLTPACFLEPPCSTQLPVDMVEQQVFCEPIKGIVLCSTPDSVSLKHQTIIDNKTSSGNLQHYANDRQVKVYAFNLAMNGIEIRHGLYLCEIWSKDRKELLGYGRVEQHFDARDINKVWQTWLKPRMELLRVAYDEVKKRMELNPLPMESTGTEGLEMPSETAQV
jgi:hypothetical protein